VAIYWKKSQCTEVVTIDNLGFELSKLKFSTGYMDPNRKSFGRTFCFSNCHIIAKIPEV
jgi:hypothetical protein